MGKYTVMVDGDEVEFDDPIRAVDYAQMVKADREEKDRQRRSDRDWETIRLIAHAVTVMWFIVLSIMVITSLPVEFRPHGWFLLGVGIAMGLRIART